MRGGGNDDSRRVAHRLFAADASLGEAAKKGNGLSEVRCEYLELTKFCSKRRLLQAGSMISRLVAGGVAKGGALSVAVAADPSWQSSPKL